MRRLSRVLLGVPWLSGPWPRIPSRAAEPDKLLPADADTVVTVNIKQILDTDIIKKYALEQLKQALDGQDAKKLLTELGLDPLKDIDRIVVGANIKGRHRHQVLDDRPRHLRPGPALQGRREAVEGGRRPLRHGQGRRHGRLQVHAGERREPDLRHGRQRQDRHRRVRPEDDRQRPQGRRGGQEGADQDRTRRSHQADGREGVGLRLRPREGQVRRAQAAGRRQHPGRPGRPSRNSCR